MPEPTSCTHKEPFIKLQPDGQASILDYNLPQSTTYTAVGFIDLGVEASKFTTSAATKPTDNFWDDIGEIDLLQAEIRINDDIIGASLRPAFSNVSLLKNFDAINKEVFEEAEQTYIGNLNKDTIAQQIVNKRRPQLYRDFFGVVNTRFIEEPSSVEPKIMLALNYKMATYLGDYGAGKTLKTFSLLPGERTTITIRNYTLVEEIKKRAESVLDSFSKSSASEVQSILESMNRQGSMRQTAFTAAVDASAQANASLDLGILKIGGGGGGGVQSSYSVNTATQNLVENLASAVNTQSSNADSLREIDVNTESSTLSVNEKETTTIRELSNINQSRVLNFVFRQLLQEFITITYLDSVSVIFTNGYPESSRTVKLSELDGLINDVIVQEQRDSVKNLIYENLCSIYDYTGTRTSFIEKVDDELVNCITGTEGSTQTYVRKRKDLSQTAEGISVSGIIMDVKKRIMRTPAVVVDALLGQGEALDCYNQKLQDAATLNATLDNDRLTQMMEVINSIDDPAQKADLYKKVFGDCCDVPQSCCCGNCSGTNEPTA